MTTTTHTPTPLSTTSPPTASSALDLLRPSSSSDLTLDEEIQIFEKYASIEKNGQKYMSRDDFVAAIAHAEDNKIIMEQSVVLFSVADTKRKGLLALEDFVAFANLLSKPDAGYEIAFRFFDPNGTGKITLDQFRKIITTRCSQDSLPFDFNCDWLKLYVGSEGSRSRELTYEEFSQLLKDFQAERLRQGFKHYDSKGTGHITADDFEKIIISIDKYKLSDFLINNLPTIRNLSVDNHISYALAVAFYNVIRQIDMVDRVVSTAIAQSPDRKITKQDFLNASKSTKCSMFTPLEADIIFHFAGLGNTSDRLEQKDFSRFLKPEWYQPQQIRRTVTVKRKEGVLGQFLHQLYSFTLGSMAGAVGATAVYPIDLLKTRMQNQRTMVVGELMYRNSFDCFKKVVKNEGFWALYSGLGPQLIGVAPEKAIKLTVNDYVRSLAKDKETGEIPLKYEILSGASAGASQVVFTNPLEIVKINLQLQGETAQKDTAIRIVRKLGLLGLFKGSRACLLRDVPFSAIYFPSYAHLKKDFFKEGPNHKLDISELLLAGAIAGMPAAYFATPADVIKTRLQAQLLHPIPGQAPYKGLVDCAKTIYRVEGFTAFFKGGPARVLRSSPQFGVTLMVYELLQRWLPWDVSGASAGKSMESSDLGYLRNRDGLRILSDLGYKFGVPPI